MKPLAVVPILALTLFGLMAPSIQAQTVATHDYELRVAFSPDGRTAAVPNRKSVQLLDVKSGKQLASFEGHEFTIYCVTFSPDGRFILSGDGNCLRLWDVQSGKQVVRLKGRNGRLSSLAISAEGRYAVSGHSQGDGIELRVPHDAFLWDLSKGEEVCQREFLFHRWITQRLFYGFYESLPDSLIERLPNIVRDLFEGETHREIYRFDGQKHVNCVAFSADSQKVLCGQADGTAQILEVATGKESCCFKGHKGDVLSVAFAPDGHGILTAGDDGTVRLWRLPSEVPTEPVKREDRCYRGHEGPVYSVAFSADGRRALSGGKDQTVRLWDLETGKELACFRELKDTITSVAFTPDGQHALCGTEALAVRLWKLPE